MPLYSLPIYLNRISGRLGDQIYFWVRGKQYVKNAPANVRNPQTPRRQQIRDNFAAISTNGILLNSSHSDLTMLTVPPPTHGTPRYPFGFCVSIVSPTQNCISWTDPGDPNTYISAYHRLDGGFCGEHPCYGNCPTTGETYDQRFIGTARASDCHIDHDHDYPANTRLYYRLRSVSTWAKKSPYTHEIEIIAPA